MMKSICFLFAFAFCCLHLLGQTTPVPTEYKRGDNNTYIVDYLPNLKWLFVANEKCPFTRENELTWQDWYRIDTKAVWNLSQYMKPYIGPYLKNVALTKEDVFIANIWFDLQGNPAYITFRYSAKLNIPITVIEQIETSLKTNGKVKVTPTPKYDHKQKIYYLQLGTAVYLKELQDELC